MQQHKILVSPFSVLSQSVLHSNVAQAMQRAESHAASLLWGLKAETCGDRAGERVRSGKTAMNSSQLLPSPSENAHGDRERERDIFLKSYPTHLEYHVGDGITFHSAGFNPSRRGRTHLRPQFAVTLVESRGH